MQTPSATALLDERFLLLDTLGRGGMGSVVRAFDRDHERVVALKIPTDGGDTLPTEFEVWSRLRHPNVIRALALRRAEVGPLPPGTPYLVLESFGGVPLTRAVPPGHAPPERIEAVAREVLTALDHVHAAGLVHRDLSPGNVLVDAPTGRPIRVKLTDFGLSVPAGRSGEPGKISGCLPFVSPEAILGLPVDGRADLYALGVVLFLLATGRTPAPGRAVEDVVRWHVGGARPDPEAHLGFLPPRLARFVVRLLERCCDDRPASAGEALDALGVAVHRRAPPWSQGLDRSAVAALRLALDAVGRGARRAFRLPGTAREAARLTREAETAAQLRGLSFVRLDLGARRPAARALAGAALRVLHPLDAAAPAVRRHGLHEVLPIGFVGAHPVLDLAASAPQRAVPPHRDAAGAVASFLCDAARKRPFVLSVAARALADPLVGRVIDGLLTGERPEAPPPGIPGGYLVLIPAGATSSRSSSRSSRTGSRLHCAP
jgi:hypothetical protein